MNLPNYKKKKKIKQLKRSISSCMNFTKSEYLRVLKLCISLFTCTVEVLFSSNHMSKHLHNNILKFYQIKGLKWSVDEYFFIFSLKFWIRVLFNTKSISESNLSICIPSYKYKILNIKKNRKIIYNDKLLI